MKTYTHSQTNSTTSQQARIMRSGLFLTVLIFKKIIIPISAFSVNGLIDIISRFHIVLLTAMSLLLLNVSTSTAQTLQWDRRYNGPSSLLDEGAKVKTDAAGNVYVTGTSQSDMLTVKYNAAGVQQWTRRYNRSYVDYYEGFTYSTVDNATDLQIDGSGNIYVTGTVRYTTFDDFHTEIITIKYNPSGTVLWENVSTYLTTGPENIQAPHSFIDGAGNIYVTVSYSSYADGYAIDMAKMTSTGTDVWTRSHAVADYIKVTANAIHVDGSGNVYVAGSVDQMNGNYLTLKYNSAGTLQWQRQYNGPASLLDEAVKVKTDAAGNVYVTGTSQSDMLTVKYNAAGVQQWTARYNVYFYSTYDAMNINTRDRATDLQVDAAGNVYVTGSSYYDDNAYRTDVVTIKYNTSGVKQWERATANAWIASDVENAHSVLDGSGSLYIATSYLSDNSIGHMMELDKINSSGTLLWSRNFQPTGWYDVDMNAMHVDSPGNVYITGKVGQNNGDYLTLKYAVQQTVRINSGGPVLRTSLGSFSADAYLTGSSSTNSSTAAIAGTTDDALYQAYRWANVAGGSFGYNIPVVNGRYTVKLHFVETYYTIANKRKFNVTAEGAAWLTNYDIAADGGVNTAKVKTRTLTITDGNLTLNFRSVLDNAIVCAVEVIPAPAATGRESAEEDEAEIKSKVSSEILTSLEAYPNPFTEKITFSFTVLQNSPVRLEVYDMQGSLVEGLFNEEAEAGRKYDMEWKAANQSAGMYLVRLATGSSVSTKKVVLMK